MILAVWRCWLLFWEPVVGVFMTSIWTSHMRWLCQRIFAVIPVKRWWWMERSASFRITRFSMSSCQYVLPRKLRNKTLMIQWCLEDDSFRFDKWSFGYPNSFIFPGCTHIGVIETPSDEADQKPSDFCLTKKRRPEKWHSETGRILWCSGGTEAFVMFKFLVQFLIGELGSPNFKTVPFAIFVGCFFPWEAKSMAD